MPCAEVIEMIMQFLAGEGDSQNQNQNELYWPGMFTHTRDLLKWQKLLSATEWQQQDSTQTTQEQYTNMQISKYTNNT